MAFFRVILRILPKDLHNSKESEISERSRTSLDIVEMKEVTFGLISFFNGADSVTKKSIKFQTHFIGIDK